jgi:hypothetical protein
MLQAFPVSTLAWRDWKRAHPDGWVLSQDTGFSRDYGTNPYTGYDDEHSRPFLYSGRIDPRLPAKARVVGFDDTQRVVAVPLATLRTHRVLHVYERDRAVVVWWKPGTASALDSSSIRAGRDVGATQAFAAALDGQSLHFKASGASTFRDRETGSTWDFLGHAISGSLAGRNLTSVEHLDTFWFAWAAFHPQTTIIK